MTETLVPALGVLRDALHDLAGEHDRTVKLGRTHLVDAVPMTFADEAGAWARMVGVGIPFVREPKVESYGTVAVFQDLYGNLWDLLQPSAPPC